MARPALSIAQAAKAIRQGELIAYPTEAVWGLGCDPFNAAAVASLLALKQRPVEKGLILVVANLQQLHGILAEESLTAEKLQQLQARSVQPVTWLVPIISGSLPGWITGKHSKVAVRISEHPVVKALCEASGLPLVSTSANPAGCQPAREQFQVRRYFADQLAICRGRIGSALQPSRIIDLQTGQTLRE